jgi:hypothetical protein
VISVDDVTWWIPRSTWSEIDADIVSVVGKDVYDRVLRPAFRQVVVAYINVEDRCAGQQGNTVRPIGGTPTGGKLLKVRLGIPGRGKSGSLRILASLHCEERRCHILLARWRRDADEADEALASARDEPPRR